MATTSISVDDSMDDSSSWTTATRKKDRSTGDSSNTEKTGRKHEVLLKIGIPIEARGKVNIHAITHEVFTNLFKQHPDVTIKSMKEEFSFSSMEQFPPTEEAYKTFFQHETEYYQQPRKNCGSCMMKFYITSLKSMEEIKSGPFLRYLRDNGISIFPHSMTTLRASKMAVLIFKHPTITNIPVLADRIRERYREHFTQGNHTDLPPGLNASTSTEIFVKHERMNHRINHKNGPSEMVSTEVLVLYTNAEYATSLATLTVADEILPEEEFGHFVPWCVRHEQELFGDKIRAHNAFMARLKTLKIEGVTREMMKSPFSIGGNKQTSYQYITYKVIPPKTSINGNEETEVKQICFAPEPTKFTDERGRWLVPYLPEHEEEAQELMDTMINHWRTQNTTRIQQHQQPRIVTRNHNNPAQAYISQQRAVALPPHVQTNPTFFNHHSIPRRNRPPVVIDIDDTSRRSWAQIAQQSQVSSTGSSFQTRNEIHQEQKPDDGSEATTARTNRTGIDSIIQQLRADHEKTMQEYREASEKRIKQLEKRVEDNLAMISAKLELYAEKEEAREARYEAIHNRIGDSQVKLGEHMAQLMLQMTNLSVRIGETQAAGATTEMDLNRETYGTPTQIPTQTQLHQLSGRKRINASRTPEKSLQFHMGTSPEFPEESDDELFSKNLFVKPNEVRTNSQEEISAEKP